MGIRKSQSPRPDQLWPEGVPHPTSPAPPRAKPQWVTVASPMSSSWSFAGVRGEWKYWRSRAGKLVRTNGAIWQRLQST